MTAGPGDDMAAAGGHARASRADRERVIDALKVAFVEERLTKDELDDRVGQAYTSRTYAELAAITADLPPAPQTPGPQTPAPPARQPARAAARTPAERPPVGRAKKAVLISVMLTFQPILLVLAIVLNNEGAARVVAISLPVYLIFVTIAGLGLIDSRQERRERPRQQGPPPPAQPLRPAQPARPLECGHDDDLGHDLTLSHASRPAPGIRPILGIRPAPGIAPA